MQMCAVLDCAVMDCAVLECCVLVLLGNGKDGKERIPPLQAVSLCVMLLLL